MKTYAIHLPTVRSSRTDTQLNVTLNTTIAHKPLLAIMVALLPALAIITLSLWASMIGAPGILSAIYWTGGFIFLAMVVDAEGDHGKAFAYSGVSLMILAWLNWSVAPEFGVLAGFLISAWVSVTVLNRSGLIREAVA